jgi:TatD DNase family protein
MKSLKNVAICYFCPMQLIDTHTHLYLEQFDKDRAEMLQRAKDEGVSQFLLPAIDKSTFDVMWELCEMDASCKPMMGLHPCSVKDDFESELEFVESELRKGKYVAVGEIGIDLYWDKTFLEQQKTALARQIEWAKELNLPIVIHARESFDEIFEVIDQLNDEKLRGVFHCFTGTMEQAKHILDYGGFYLGLGGVLTYKKGGIDKIVHELPLDKIVLETDSPYLTPTPFRGKRNESAYVRIVAQKLADLLEVSLESVALATSQNAKELFRL